MSGFSSSLGYRFALRDAQEIIIFYPTPYLSKYIAQALPKLQHFSVRSGTKFIVETIQCKTLTGGGVSPAPLLTPAVIVLYSCVT